MAMGMGERMIACALSAPRFCGPGASLARGEVKGMVQSSSPVSFPSLRHQQKSIWRVRNRKVVSVLREEVAPEKGLTPQTSEATRYNDSWLERKAIGFLTRRLEKLSGKTTELEGYDGFVDMTRKLVHGLPVSTQRDTVHVMLHTVLPDRVLTAIRAAPNGKWMKEFYATFTVIFFKWLVGESEIREGEVDGVLMKSTVHIKKCRYLENSQCIGLCVNLCKNPTQDFITKQFGMPLTMNPNFEDMSCDMIYGQQPPPIEEDEAYKQPCYTICKTAKPTRPNCA